MDRSAVRGGSLFVGRRVELTELLGAVPEPDGHGSLVLLSGEPGAGKTRLAAEVARRVAATGGRRLVGRCWSGGDAPPYWPWVHALRTELGRRDVDLAELVGAQDAGADRFALFDSTVTTLAEVADGRPSVLVLDDLHDADVGSLLLARFVATELASLPLLVIGTYRPDEAVRRPDVALHIGALERLGSTMELAGLDVDEVAELIGDDARAAEVRDRTGGNPLFVLHEATAHDARAGDRRAFGVRAAVAARLDPLDEDERTTIRAIALLGPAAADVELVARLSGHDADTVRRHLADAVRDDLLQPIGHHGELAFTHPLLEEVLVQDLPEQQRTAWHLQAAQLLRDDPDHAAEVAGHLVAAGRGHEDAAVSACVAAAEQAARSLVHERAVTQLRTAVDLLARVPGDTRPRRLRLLIELGRAQWRASHRTAAEEAFAAAADLAVELGDDDALVDAALGGGFQSDYSGDAVRRRTERIDAALEVLRGDSAHRARLLALAATHRFVEPDPGPARSMAAEALAMAQRVGDPTALGEALVARQVVEPGPATLARRRRECREIVALGESTGDRALVLQGRFHLIGALLESGDIAAIDAELAAQRAVVDEIAEPAYSRHTWWFRCMRHLVDGHADAAEEASVQGLAAAEAAADPDGLLVHGGQLAPIRWLQGRVGEMEPLWLDLRRDDPTNPLWGATVAWLWATTGQLDAAQGAVTAMGDPASIPDDRHWLLTLCAAAEAVASVGDAELAAAYREQLLPYERRSVPIAMGIAYWGSVARPLGLLADTLGRRAEADQHLRTAVEVTGRLGARPWLAQAQLDLAELRGDPELVEEAAATVELLGLVGLQPRVDEVRESTAKAAANATTGVAATPVPIAGGGTLRVTAAPSVAGTPRISVMGTFEVVGADGTVARWSSRKARELLKILVARRGAPAHREHLMDLLWPGIDPALLGNRLSVALSTVRRALDPRRALDTGAVVAGDRTSVRLQADAVVVDVDAFLDRSGRALDAARDLSPDEDREAMTILTDALDAYGGEVFADEPYADWAGPLRDEARSAMVAVARALATCAERDGDGLTALHAHRRVLEVDSYDDHAHRGTVRLLEALGAHGQAEAARRRHCEALAELGLVAD